VSQAARGDAGVDYGHRIELEAPRFGTVERRLIAEAIKSDIDFAIDVPKREERMERKKARAWKHTSPFWAKCQGRGAGGAIEVYSGYQLQDTLEQKGSNRVNAAGRKRIQHCGVAAGS